MFLFVLCKEGRRQGNTRRKWKTSDRSDRQLLSLRVSVMRSGQLSLLFTRFITLNDSPHISKCVISQHCLAQLRATIFMFPACLLILWTWSDAAAHIPAGSDQQSSRPGSLRCNQLLGLGLSVCVHTGTDDQRHCGREMRKKMAVVR